MKESSNGINKEKGYKRSPVSAICSALGTALLIGVIAMCIPFTLPKTMGYQVYTVVSGSMEPEIPVGSLVYVGQVEAQDVAMRDVIAFYGGRDSNAIVTHRVVENRVVMGEFITKGDANQTEDMNPVAYEHFIGRVEKVIPKLGMVAQLMTGKDGKIATGCLIGLALVMHMLASVLDRGRAKE